MLEIDYSKWSYVRCPDAFWDVLMETLVLDAESATTTFELRKEIDDSLEAIQTLILISQEEVTLKVGDEFDVVPVSGGVIVKKKG